MKLIRAQLSEPRDPDAEPEPELSPPTATAPTPARPKRVAAEFEGDDADLAERLRSWRREQSTADGVPAYVVFNDETLEGIVAAMPTDHRELGRVKGIGPAKIDKYGETILAIVAGES